MIDATSCRSFWCIWTPATQRTRAGEIRAQLKRSEEPVRRYCEDPVCNQLLSYYAQWAEAEQIGFSVKTNLAAVEPGNRTGIMVSLCNVLENAVLACKKDPDPDRRSITLSLWAQGRHIFLEARNSFDGELLLNPSTGLPDAREPGHGYGLQSLAAIAGQAPSCTVKDGYFTISLLL